MYNTWIKLLTYGNSSLRNINFTIQLLNLDNAYSTFLAFKCLSFGDND